MLVPLILSGVSLLGFLVSFLVDGPDVTVWTAIAGLSLLASLVLVLQAALRRKQPHGRDPDPRTQVFVDGSNVMFWDGEEPRLATVIAVVRALEAKGLRPGVMFDANAGYKILGRYLDDADLARALDLPEDQVLVVPKGTIADEYLLRAARALKARIVTNDKYRDWAKQFSEVRKPGHLIKGEVLNGKVRLS